MEIRVRGAEQYRDLARRLRGAANRGLRREMSTAIRRATNPLRKALRRSARSLLPRTGGLGQTISRSSMRIQRRTAGATVGIRMVTTSPHDIKAIDQGRVRHPLYGNRRHWYLQDVPPGWWATPTDETQDTTREELLAALDRVREQIKG